MKRLLGWLIRLRYLMAVLCIGLTAVASTGLEKLVFRSDYRMFFGEENPQLKAFDKLQNTFSKNENLLFVIAPESGKVFTAFTLSAVEALTEKAWKLPFANRVDSVTNFQHSFARGDDVTVVDLVEDAARKMPSELALIERAALAEPLLVNRLISPDGKVTGINVTFRLPDPPKAEDIHAVVDTAGQIVSDIQSDYPGLKIHLTGSVMMDNAFEVASNHDGQTLIPLMATLVILTLWLLLRSFWGMLVSVLVIAMSIVTALGLAGWLGIPLSPTAVVAPNIILTLAVADCIHLLNGFYVNARLGVGKNQAILNNLTKNFKPVFLTSLTTAIGFLSMNSSDAPPFHDLGNITAIGVTAAYLYSILFLPACMLFLPVPRKRNEQCAFNWQWSYSRFLKRRGGWVLVGSVLFIAIPLAFIFKIEPNDEFVKYFDESIEFRRATDFTTDHLTGIYYIDFAVDSEKSSGISDPEYMQTLEAFAQWFRAQPETLHVFSVTDILKKLHRNMHGDDPSYYRLPDSQDLIAQYLLMYEMSLPFGLDLNDRIDVDKASTRMTVTLKSISSRQVLSLEEQAGQWLKQHELNPETSYGSGTTVMFAHIGQRNIETMLKGTVTAFVLISLIMIVALRSFKIGALSLLPNLVPAAMAFGVWGAFIGQVGLAVSVIAAMTLGIVVDDTVHFLYRYQHARRALKQDAAGAVEYALANAGKAMFATTVVLATGFAVLAFSSFEINSSMGLLTSVAIIFAFLADFVFLPSLLIKFEELKNESQILNGLVSKSGI